jgi:hypothetical protein
MLAIAGLLCTYFIGKFILWEFIFYRVLKLCFNMDNNVESGFSDMHILEGNLDLNIFSFTSYYFIQELRFQKTAICQINKGRRKRNGRFEEFLSSKYR